MNKAANLKYKRLGTIRGWIRQGHHFRCLSIGRVSISCTSGLGSGVGSINAHIPSIVMNKNCANVIKSPACESTREITSKLHTFAQQPTKINNHADNTVIEDSLNAPAIVEKKS